jgi:isopenicillin N synthase-like dioxygenase
MKRGRDGLSVPVVDLSMDDAQVCSDLLDAYERVGFGYLVGHGVDRELVAQLFEASRRFHSLPLAQKMAIELNELHRGYIPINTSTDRNSELATVTKPNQSASFMVMGEAGPDDADVRAGAFLAGPNQWPELADFRPVVETYQAAMVELGHRLMRLFMAALGQSGPPPGSFEPPTTWLRLLHYPPHPVEDGLFGSAPHVDFGAVTLLAQDNVGGLQVQSPEGEWLDVAPLAGAFVLNTGSMLRRWSNGRLRATPHRVVNRSGRERYSCPFFFDPHVDTIIEPLRGCVTPSRPPQFDPIEFGTFLKQELRAGYDRHATSID